MYEIPVVLFLFKRTNSLYQIIGRLREIQPKKVYLIADGPRSEEEKAACDSCRMLAEDLIDWECVIERNYAETNRGVIDNIGGGAKWVFERERWAVFLEDDNCPETCFFSYCEEMLKRYESNDKIIWICGTSYYPKLELETSYVFTKHLLPCGWASWSKKFNKYYDIDLKTFEDEEKRKQFKDSYDDIRLYKQQLHSVERTKYLIETSRSSSSWDYQMLYSIRSNGLFGIAPCNNLITNIGVDEYSIHGGNSTKKVMTNRFCLVESCQLEYPLKHPELVETNIEFEKLTTAKILLPIHLRIVIRVGRILKQILGINVNESITAILRNRKYGMR